MSKSVYSLVLTDEVVEEIDRMAYQMNTSRSNLINQILAERVSFSTPEMQMRDIFASLERLMDETFQIQEQPSEAMLSIRSRLRYKYKPTIRYRVELYRDPGDRVGSLRVSFRTQNSALIEALDEFFRIWILLENHYLASVVPQGIPRECAKGQFTRELMRPPNRENLTSEELGNAIADYIRLLDSLIKIYFAGLDTPEETTAMLEEQYRKQLREGMTFV